MLASRFVIMIWFDDAASEQPSHEDLMARVSGLTAVVAEQAALIETLRAEVAALRRQAGRDSLISSQPPG